MKIKKLVLHNIASIVDAEIDFTKQPLADTDLFLITGKTGSGKTTILDAICLALYNKVPRIEKSSGNKQEINNDSLVANDPRNIMRQNTGEAFVKLYFVGNDGVDYCADWSVRRGKKAQLTTQISNQIWAVLDAGGNTLVSADNSRKYSETETFITQKVGLDYNQFCRTTLLAQGEFTKFLKSSENEKAEILEKISGTDKFRKIGIAIYNKTLSMEKAYKEAAKDNQQIVVLGDEERNELEKQQKDLEISVKDKSDKVEEVQNLIDWLQDKNLHTKNLAEAQNELTVAKSAVSSEDFLGKEKQVREWEETIQVRANMSDAEGQYTNKVNATTCIGGLELLYKEAMCGVEFVKTKLSENKQEHSKLAALLQAEKDYVSVYENAQTIEAELNNYVNSRNDLSKKIQEKQSILKKELPDAEEKNILSSIALKAAVKEFEEAEAKLGAYKKELDECNLPAKRARKELLDKVKNQKERVEERDKEIAQANKNIEENSVKLESCRQVLEVEGQELERLDIEHKRRLQTVNAFAKNIRTSLIERLGEDDNICPVCGQKVVSLEFTEEALDLEKNKIEAEFNAQKDKVDKAREEVATLEGSIKSETDALNKKTSDRTELYNTLVSLAEGDNTLLEASINQIEDLITKASEAIEKGELLEKNRDAAQELYNNLQGKKSQAELNKQTNENSVNTLKVRLDTIATEIGNLENSLNILLISITDKIPDSLNLKLDLGNPAEFINYLKSKASDYKTNNDKLAQIEREIENISKELSNIESICESVLQLKPDLASIEGISPIEKNNLHQIWVKLNSEFKAETDKLATAEKEYNRLSALVNEFVNDHKEYSIEYLGMLNKITQNTIGEYRKQVETQRSKYVAAEKTLNTMQENVDTHLSKKPTNLTDEDTEQSLNEKKKLYNDERDALNIQIGEIAKTLQTDDEARRKKQDTAHIDALKEEYEKWKAFNSLYGDAQGNTLSKIAQGFLLEGMLIAANHHLENMAKRYKLHIVPGSLILKLEDAYNGYAMRATDTLSGGESFLLSLALALALADFGQHLGVSTLFIDEGFGTLSGDELQSAINTLKSLHSKVGRQVGIISHREEIRESIPVQISVHSKTGSSESAVGII